MRHPSRKSQRARNAEYARLAPDEHNYIDVLYDGDVVKTFHGFARAAASEYAKKHLRDARRHRATDVKAVHYFGMGDRDPTGAAIAWFKYQNGRWFNVMADYHHSPSFPVHGSRSK